MRDPTASGPVYEGPGTAADGTVSILTWPHGTTPAQVSDGIRRRFEAGWTSLWVHLGDELAGAITYVNKTRGRLQWWGPDGRGGSQ